MNCIVDIPLQVIGFIRYISCLKLILFLKKTTETIVAYNLMTLARIRIARA